MATQNSKGFTACGQYYIMGYEQESIYVSLKRMLDEIRQNALKHKLGGYR